MSIVRPRWLRPDTDTRVEELRELLADAQARMGRRSAALAETRSSLAYQTRATTAARAREAAIQAAADAHAARLQRLRLVAGDESLTAEQAMDRVRQVLMEPDPPRGEVGEHA